MPTSATCRAACALLATLLTSLAGATCQVQATGLPGLTYTALGQAEGILRLVVRCDAADETTSYTLRVSALGGRFDQASGTYVVAAVGRGHSPLQMQIQGAVPALGGSIAPTVYTGSQDLRFPVTIPAGQWQASGTPTVNLTFDLSPLATGHSLP